MPDVLQPEGSRLHAGAPLLWIGAHRRPQLALAAYSAARGGAAGCGRRACSALVLAPRAWTAAA